MKAGGGGALNPRNETEWEMLLNPNAGHFCLDEEEAEQIRPTHEFQLRRDHHTGHPCRRHVGNNALLLLLNSAAAGSVLHNRMTARFANLSVELSSRPSRRQIRKAADKKEIIGNGRPRTSLREIFLK